MKRAIILTALILFSCGINHAANVRFEAGLQYFTPSEQAFRTIYGSGVIAGIKIGIGIWQNFELGLTGSTFSKKGELTYTQEETTLKIMPVGIVIRYVHPAWAGVDVYGGFGINYFSFKEENAIGKVHTSKIGYVGTIGTYVKVIDGLFLDLYLDYSTCHIKPEDLKVNIGGFGAGAGIGYQF